MDPLDSLTVANLLEISRVYVHLPRNATRTRPKLLEALRALPGDVLNQIREAALKLVDDGRVRHKRQRRDNNSRPRKRRRRDPMEGWEYQADEGVVETRSFNLVSERRVEAIIASDFLKVPSEETLQSRLCAFIDNSSQKALSTGVCASCARIRFQSQLSEVALEKLPNKALLAPSVPHPAHVLHQGLLLHVPSITNNGLKVILCTECIFSLRKNSRPQYSLANKMWVGDIPFELEGLTLPERLLIARYFPAAFIIKLYPKQRGARAWDRAQMQNGLRGNVSTGSFQLYH